MPSSWYAGGDELRVSLAGAIPMMVLEDGLAQSASAVSPILHASAFRQLPVPSANRIRRRR